MKILIVHNYYQQTGGEDSVFHSEVELLNNYGQTVSQITASNDEIHSLSPAALFVKTIWNTRSYQELAEKFRQEKPDVVHFHNIFPLISPSAYQAAWDFNIPVIQTLHNYRLFCLNALLYRNNRPCELCLGKTPPLPGVFLRCYRNSYPASATVAAMLTIHRWLGSWAKKVDLYLALTEFARNKFIQGGIPQNRVVVKPNFVFPDPGFEPGRNEYYAFLGRLTSEKGIETLLAAWNLIPNPPQLFIAGLGPLSDFVQQTAQANTAIQYLGAVPHEKAISLLKGATALVFPSTWYEGFPMVIAEAFATGLPVIASKIGNMETLISDGENGFHFAPGDAANLAEKIIYIEDHRDRLDAIRKNAREHYEQFYSAEKNYQQLMSIYQGVIDRRKHGLH